MLIDFRERKEERRKHQLYAPWWRIEPATQAHTLTANQTHNLLVYGVMLQPTDHRPGLLLFKTNFFKPNSVSANNIKLRSNYWKVPQRTFPKDAVKLIISITEVSVIDMQFYVH